jgi:signal transduction histidine kinase/CheY-like chemotaxis protein
MRRPVLAFASLAAAYLVSGELGLLLAVPPGYASPVFPAAGIAMAGALIWGPAALPPVILGSFVLNAWTGYAVEHRLAAASLAAAAIIALSSALQAWVGGRTLRRAVGHPALLDNGRDLSRFLLLSPLCCTISTTLSLAALFALSIVTGPDLAASWVSWWIGDTLGVLVLLPLMLILAGEPRDLWRRRALPVGLPMVLLFALFVAIFVRVSKWEHDEALLDFRLLSRQMVDNIHAGLVEQDVFLEQLETAFGGPMPVTRSDFHRLVQNLLRRFSTIQAVKWAPRIDAAHRADFEAAQQADLPGFEIREVDASGQRRRSGERPYYYPVTYVEPLKGNEHIVGFDLASEAGRNAAIEETLRTGAVAATPPIRLVQERGEQVGILLVFAVHDGVNGPGLVSVALRMGTFMDGLLAPVNEILCARAIDLQGGKTIYDGFPPGRTDASYEGVFGFGGHRYDVLTAPTASYLERHRRWQSWAVLVAGVFGTGLIGALLMLGTGYARRIEAEVGERTRAHEAVNRRLKVEVEERQQAETALRQAQRMEAIGQLTGGVAHDFNNLLTVVSGNAELLRDSAPDDAVRRRAAAIMRAAERGERLTRQLLAFARRQTPRLEPVDLKQRASEIADMLSRSLRSDIKVSVEMPPDLWPVAIDPAEFELALLNVAVNARDAMPKGGSFRMAARNLSCGAGDPECQGLGGDFITVSLSDTGAGMGPEVLARAFEPYFTTKDVGIGSGLGLSQVYGFAKGSGGAARITSAPGRGATVTLLLPRATGTAAAASVAAAIVERSTTAARILLVEDDREVAQVTAELLRDLGCDPIEAHDAGAALAAVDRDPTIALVLSDIVLTGGISGLDLARRLRAQRPELPVLLATGYSEHVPPALAEGFALVTKPYRREMLATAIATALEPAASVLSS